MTEFKKEFLNMVTKNELRKIAKEKLKDAEVLYSKGRYDCSVYICGYAVEIMLKARICRTLKWNGYPSTRAEFQNYQSFKTHNLEVLLRLSGLETMIKNQYMSAWSDIIRWDPEIRYKSAGTAGHNDALAMIEAVKTLMRRL